MRPYSLYPLLTAARLLDNDFEDLVLLSFRGPMDDLEYEDGEEGSEQEEDLGNEEDDGEEDDEEGDSDYDTEDEAAEEQQQQQQHQQEVVNVEVEEQVVQVQEDDDDDDDEDSPVPPKRRLLHYPPSQPMEAGTSTGGITFPAVMRSAAADSAQPGPASIRAFIEPVRRVIAQRPLPVLIQNSTLHIPLQITNSVAAIFQNSHSRSQQVQTDAPENGLPRPLVRQIAQHNLPQARVVLRLPNDIGDMYPREE